MANYIIPFFKGFNFTDKTQTNTETQTEKTQETGETKEYLYTGDPSKLKTQVANIGEDNYIIKDGKKTQVSIIKDKVYIGEGKNKKQIGKVEGGIINIPPKNKEARKINREYGNRVVYKSKIYKRP